MNKMTTRTRLRALLAGDGLVSFGGWIDYIAILTLSVFRWKADQYDMALIGAATLLPGILLARPIGLLVNGPHVMHWLRASLLLRALCTVALLLAGSLQGFIALAVIRAAFNSLALPGITVLSARSVPEEERTRYYSLLNMLNSAAKMGGPALGSAIAALGSDRYTLMFSGALTLLGLTVFCLIPAQSATGVPPLRAAATASAANRLTGPAWQSYAGVMLVYFAMVCMVNNQLPVILNALRMNKGVLGMLASASAVGNFLYGWWRAKRSTRQPLAGLLSELLVPAMATMAVFVLIACYLVWSDALRVEPLLACFFLSGIVSARFAISANVYLATHFGEQLGQASGRLQSVQNAAMLAAPFAGAFVLTHSSAGLLFMLSGLLGLFCLSAIRVWTTAKAVPLAG